jgi:hypothetical protein
MLDPDPKGPDFQTVLESLLDIYRPILEEDLKRASDLHGQCGRQPSRTPNRCDDDRVNAKSTTWADSVTYESQLHGSRSRREVPRIPAPPIKLEETP